MTQTCQGEAVVEWIGMVRTPHKRRRPRRRRFGRDQRGESHPEWLSERSDGAGHSVAVGGHLRHSRCPCHHLGWRGSSQIRGSRTGRPRPSRATSAPGFSLRAAPGCRQWLESCEISLSPRRLDDFARIGTCSGGSDSAGSRLRDGRRSQRRPYVRHVIPHHADRDAHEPARFADLERRSRRHPDAVSRELHDG